MRLMTLVVTLGLVAVACGSESAGGAVAPDDAPQSIEDIDFSSPIEDFLGYDFDSDEDAQARYEEFDRQAEQLTAECMLDKGFQYIPPNRDVQMQFGPESDLPYFSAEWIEKYGFGITTQRFPQSQVGDLVGFADNFPDPGEMEAMDPNSAYLESLSELERQAYEDALNGVMPEFGPDGPDEDFDFEPSGCQFEAYEQVWEDAGEADQEAFYEEFSDQLESLYERIDADPRIVDFNDAVSSCVAERGEVWIDEDALRERFEGPLEALQPRVDRDPFAGTGLDPDTMSDRALQDFYRELYRLDDDQLAALAELQAQELALAKLVVECGGGPLNQIALEAKIRVELEQQFLDQNADAIAKYTG